MKQGSRVNFDAYRTIAKRRLPRAVFDFVDGGAGEERTLKGNSDALNALQFLPRVGVDVRNVSTGCSILDAPSSLPLVIAPTGMAGLIRPDGDVALARAAVAAGIPFTLSTFSSASMEEVAEKAPGGRLWFQLYPFADRSVMFDMVERAHAAGYEALCIAVDQPTHGRRLRDMRRGFGIPMRWSLENLIDFATSPSWSLSALRNPVRFGNLKGELQTGEALAAYAARQFDPSFSWEDVRDFRRRWSGKLIVKGLISPDDAITAVDCGADAIVVSNHGGRQLDNVCSSIEALPAVVDAVKDSSEIYMDGGIRSGADVLKAIALGAQACLMGRPGLWALSAGAENGVREMLDMFSREMHNALTLLGVSNPSQLTADYLHRRALNVAR